MIFLLVLSALITVSSAQVYSCADGYCAANFGSDRRDFLGCTYFCYLDANADGFLGRFEVQIIFRTWNNGAATCDRECFVTNYSAALPVCPSEADVAFESMAALTPEDPNSVTNNDVNAYYAQLEAIQGGNPVGPEAFRQHWLPGYVDPDCDMPFP